MCVIVLKPENVKISYKDVVNAWEVNPDGAGVSYFDDISENIIVHKGLMRLQELWSIVNSLQNKELVIHFRYSTHGEVNKGNTHPFAITSCPKVSSNCENPDRLLFHNGVLQEFGSNTLSDTLHFTTSILANISDLESQILLLESVGSKYIIMDKNSWTISLVGDFSDYKGMLVSNTYSFAPKKYIIKGDKNKYLSVYDDNFIEEYIDTYQDYYESDNLWDSDQYINRKGKSFKM